MTENQYYKVASVLSPLTSSLSNSSLKDSDPVLYYLLQFFYGVIKIHVGPRFDAEVNAMGRADLVGNVVNQIIHYDPLPISQEDSYKFPLLAAYRISEQYDYKTVTWYSIKSEIQVLYILPPLTSDQNKRLIPLTTHVVRSLMDRTADGFDSSYNSGEQFWQEAGLDQIGFKSCDYGKFPGLKAKETSNIWFPGVAATIDCLERRMPDDDNFQSFNGFDGYIIHPDLDPTQFDYADIKLDY